MRSLSCVALAIIISLTCGCSNRGEKIVEENQGLEFFNQINGRLNIELTQPAEQITQNLANLSAKPEAKIVFLSLEPEWFESDSKEFRPLTDEELSRIAFVGPTIKLKGESENVVEHSAPNGKHFTVQELLQAVEETEREGRGNTEWFEGIDVHHIYFEGIHEEEPGVWTIYWGS